MKGLKPMHKNWRCLANDLLLLTCISGTVGIALKFTVFFDKWVYFPVFPNLFDSVFLVFAIFYLALKNRKKEVT